MKVKAIENIKRFLKINNAEHLINTNIFEDFLLTKKVEMAISNRIKEVLKNIDTEYENNLDEVDELLLNQMKISKESYYSYFKGTFPSNNPLVKGEHIELICDILTLADMGLFKGEDTKSRIAISVPPRHLKSTAITNSYPSWVMGRASWKNSIVASYGNNLVEKAGEKNREKIKEMCRNLFGVNVKNGVSSKTIWETTGGGRFKGATIRGGATGEGAELLIMDDVIKNREEANSKLIQQKVWDEYCDTFLTRLHKNGVLIVVMTRWHHADLRGKIDEYEKDEKWFKLDLTAMNETEEECDQDPLGRDINVALFPQMFDEKYFKPFKKNQRTWRSLYKQKPSADEGEYFEKVNFQYFTEDENFFYLMTETGKKAVLKSKCRMIQTIDTAQKDKEINDETGLEVWIITPDKDLLLYDLYHGRIKIPEQEKIIDQYWNKYIDDCDYQAIEDKSSGIGIIQKLVNMGRPIKAIPAKGTKVERAAQIITYYANMKVYHKVNAPWLDYYENQLLEFPSGSHDDLVDCSTTMGNIIAQESGNGGSIGGE